MPSPTLLTLDMRRRPDAAIRCCNNKGTSTISQAAAKAAKDRLSNGAGIMNSKTPTALELLLKEVSRSRRRSKVGSKRE